MIKLTNQTDEVKDLDKKRALLKDKLTLIAALKARRNTPAKLLDKVNLSLPNQSWLTFIENAGGKLSLKGIAFNNQTIARLMQNLDKTKLFKKVELAEAKQTVIEEIKLQEFSITAIILDPLLAAAGGGVDASLSIPSDIQIPREAK